MCKSIIDVSGFFRKYYDKWGRFWQGHELSPRWDSMKSTFCRRQIKKYRDWLNPNASSVSDYNTLSIIQIMISSYS